MDSHQFYGADQALLHHVDFGRVADWAGNHVVGLLRGAGLRGGTVVDLGCGSGILARVVTDAGYDVFGVDVSPDMIDLAGKEAPLADFRCASIVDVPIPAAVAVTATGEVFNHASDRRGGYTVLSDLARRAEAALVPNGVFLFDLATAGRSGSEETRRQWHDREEWTLHVAEQEDPDDQILDRRITIFRRVGPDSYRRTDERHILRLFESDAVVALLEAAGLQVEILDGYPTDQKTLPRSGWTVFQARKASAA
jgi:SAM-dependent methyltransferase